MPNGNSAGPEIPLDPEVADVLSAAGWNPERDRSADVHAWTSVLESEFPPFPQALRALSRFGGIHVPARGPGEVWTRQSFHLDPTLAAGEGDRFSDFAAMLGIRLVPLGEVGSDAFLAIGEDGRVYALMLDLWLVGQSMEEAIEVLTNGRAGTLLIEESEYRSWLEAQENRA
jgi:hypothetical protein